LEKIRKNKGERIEIKIKKAFTKDRKEFRELEHKIFRDSYYNKINFNFKDNPITEKNYFILLNNKKIGILEIGYSIEFSGKFGIGLIGILPQYRKKGYLKQTINICKKTTKRKKETTLYLSIPKESKELQTIFRKLNFKGSKDKTTVTFEDCSFGMLKDVQLKYINIKKAKKLLVWQELFLEI